MLHKFTDENPCYSNKNQAINLAEQAPPLWFHWTAEPEPEREVIDQQEPPHKRMSRKH